MSAHDTMQPIVRQSVTSEIRIRIIKLIRSGMKPGDKLPSEREIMSELGVGRSSVREAVRGLIEAGILEVRPGSGMHLANTSNVSVVSALALEISLPEDPFAQLLEARQVLEVACAGLAAKRVTVEDIASIEAELDRFEVACAQNDLDAMVAADLAFHRLMIEATRNAVFSRVILPINELLQAARRESLADPVARASVAEKHRAICEAIKNHNPTAARAAMRAHLLVFSGTHLDE